MEFIMEKADDLLKLVGEVKTPRTVLLVSEDTDGDTNPKKDKKDKKDTKKKDRDND
jgi:hypothetical protein